MLPKIVLRNQSKTQLVIAFLGAFLGVLFLLISVHYLLKVNQFGEGSEMLGPNTGFCNHNITTIFYYIFRS